MVIFKWSWKRVLIWEEIILNIINEKCFSLFNSSKICIIREVMVSCILYWLDNIRNVVFSFRYYILMDINKLENICWRKIKMIKKLKLLWEVWLRLVWNIKVFIKYFKRYRVKWEIEFFNVGLKNGYMVNGLKL